MAVSQHEGKGAAALLKKTQTRSLFQERFLGMGVVARARRCNKDQIPQGAAFETAFLFLPSAKPDSRQSDRH